MVKLLGKKKHHASVEMYACLACSCTCPQVCGCACPADTNADSSIRTSVDHNQAVSTGSSNGNYNH